jgi:thioredoxin-related protein
MKDIREENSEEYVEVTLGEYLMYSKAVRFCLVLVLILGSVGGFVWEYGQIQDTNTKLNELAEYSGYDFETHSRAVSSEAIANKASKFRKTKWFKAHDLKDSTSKSTVFSQSSKSYYVIFYKEDCSYCNQLESDMSDALSKVQKKNIYWSDITDAKDETDDDAKVNKEITWTEEEYDTTYSTKQKDFMVSGTPTMVKVTKGKKDVEVFIGTDVILNELGLSS